MESPRRPKSRARHPEDLLGAVQAVYRRKPRETVYFRSAPYTILYPTPAQIQARLKFAETARKARGLKGLSPEGLPWAAYIVKNEMKDLKTEQRIEKKPQWIQTLERYRRLMELLEGSKG